VAEILNPKVRELIKGWLLYLKTNNIGEPEDTDLKKYLSTKGYDAKLLDNLIAKLPEKKPEIGNEPQPEENKEVELNPVQKSLLGKLDGFFRSLKLDDLKAIMKGLQ